MKYANPGRAMVAGFLATVALTVLIYEAPRMGLPEMDIAALIGWYLTGLQPDPWTGVWWLGMLEHFVNGTVIFPLAYAYLIYGFLPGRPWVRGLIWGVMLFLFSPGQSRRASGLWTGPWPRGGRTSDELCLANKPVSYAACRFLSDVIRENTV